MAAAYALVSGGARLTSPLAAADVSILAAMSAWRLTKGVYRFDRDLHQSLITTQLTGDIPADVLLRIPEWCVYMDTPGLPWMGTFLHGVWVHLEWDANDSRQELRILLATTDDRLIPVSVHLGQWSLLEALERMGREARRQADLAGITDDLLLIQTDLALMARDITPIISLVLYLCADEPEIEDRTHPGDQPGHPRPKRIKGTDRIFEAKKIRIWDVGARIGETLRTGAARDPDPTATADPGVRTAPAPHVRRAHWHGYWSGPKAGDRRFSVRWMPPILVGL
ncbi:MAG: hypothetical protein HQM00_05500 [Magnetococcales bacterium]|nr:hypothetical protein [Magnetococcales bacterium]